MNIHPPDETLVEYLEGALPEPEHRAIRLALAKDPALRRRLAAVERSLTALRQVRRHEIRSQLHRLDRRWDLLLRWLPWIVMVGFLLLAWTLLRR